MMLKQIAYLLSALILITPSADAQNSQLNFGLTMPQPATTLPCSRAKHVVVAEHRKDVVKAVSDSLDGRDIILSKGWRLAPSSVVDASATSIHQAGYNTAGWYSAVVPGTVLTTLVKAGVFPDPYFGLNNLSIPDTLCRREWWYRTEFTLPQGCTLGQARVIFEGINYKAEVWLNGSRVGQVAGAFRCGDFAVTRLLRTGSQINVLAVKIIPPCNPGLVHEQSVKAGMGPNGGQLCLDGPTFIASEGWDWMPGIKDRNIGIWQCVKLRLSGDVVFQNHRIVTDLPLPDVNSADISFETEVHNLSGWPHKATVAFSFDGMKVVKRVELAPHEYRKVAFTPNEFASLHLLNPHLWWPNGYGDPYLYCAEAEVTVDDRQSDCKNFKFGIRELSYDLTVCDSKGVMRDITFNPTAAYRNGQPVFDIVNTATCDNGIKTQVPRLLVDVGSEGIDLTSHSATPYLAFRVNGVRIFIRGGNWGMDDAMKRVTREGLESAIRLHHHQHLNMIRNWTGESTEELFYSLCDEYGILVFNDFSISTQNYNLLPNDDMLMLQNVEAIVTRFRNHPSIAMWCPRNEGLLPASLDSLFTRIIVREDGTRHYGPSILVNMSNSGPWGLRPHADNFGQAIANGFSTELGTISIPTAETMRKMMPEEDLWPISDAWAYHDLHHGGWLSFDKITDELDRLYGRSSNLDEFCRKVQMYNYDAYRSMFEGFNSRMWSRTTGLLLWMSHPAWPSLLWQTYTFDRETPAAYFAVRKSCEVVHPQLNLDTRFIQIINNKLQEIDVQLTATLYDLKGNLRQCEKYRLNAMANGVTDVGVFDTKALDEPMLLRLLVRDMATGMSYMNEYWLPARQEQFAAFDILEQPKLKITRKEGVANGKITFELANVGQVAALYVKLNIRNERGNALLPALFSDGYFTLFPGEKKWVELDTTGLPNSVAVTYDTHNSEKHPLDVFQFPVL